MTTPLAPPRIRVPRQARPNEVIEIRTLAEHRMESGLRQDNSPAPPRDMLTRMVVRMNGETLFVADLRNGTATNPYHVFFARVTRTSEFTFVWTDEAGRSVSASATVLVA